MLPGCSGCGDDCPLGAVEGFVCFLLLEGEGLSGDGAVVLEGGAGVTVLSMSTWAPDTRSGLGNQVLCLSLSALGFRIPRGQEGTPHRIIDAGEEKAEEI